VASEATTEYPSATIAMKILDQIEKLRNIKVSSTSEITTSIGNLINYCNTKFLKDFQIEVVYKSIDKPQTEIKSWYFSDLNFSNIQKYILDAFQNLERNSYITQVETPKFLSMAKS
jgi:hypothetical protein